MAYALVTLSIVVQGFLPPNGAQAQVIAPQARSFPAQALRGELVVIQSPAVSMNGQSDRLSPGARIRDTSNRLVLPAVMTGQTLTVNYTRESYGLIHEVWILTDAEKAEKRPTASRPPALDSQETINGLNKLPQYRP
jgi:hypothetical protein